MKKLIVPLVILMVISFAARLARAVEKAQPCATAIVVDTSPTRYWSKIRAAAGNIYKSCPAGDTVLVFTVRGKTTRLRFASIRQREDYEFDDFCSILKSISPDWFVHADIATAIKGPVYQKLLQRSGPEGCAMIIIVSEGNLGRKQARGICKFADEIRTAHNWPLLIMGRLEKTHKELLLAAGQGRLHWCNLAAAVDSVAANKWMQHAKKAATSTLEKVTEPSAAPKAKYSKKEPSRKSNLHFKSRLTARKSGAFSKGDKNIASAPIHRSTKKVTAAPAVTRNTQSHFKTKPKSSQPPEKPTLKKYVLSLLLVVGGISFSGVVAFVMISGWLTARKWQKTAQDSLLTAQRQQRNEPKILMARVGGTSYRLGNLPHFSSVHIGSSSENTIWINNEAVAPRHLRIYRRGSKLFARNLSKSPVIINGQELSRRKRCQLTFPAVVMICEGVSIHLFLAKTSSRKNKKLEERKNAE